MGKLLLESGSGGATVTPAQSLESLRMALETYRRRDEQMADALIVASTRVIAECHDIGPLEVWYRYDQHGQKPNV
jgi:hypothetical protein